MKLYKKSVPGDNSCFFHAMGIHLRTTGASLRQLCVQLIPLYKDRVFHGLSLKDWIQYSENMTIDAYIQRLSRQYWGGSIEMMILSDYFRRPIAVYALNGKRVAMFREDLLTEPVFLLYTGNHYDALLKK
jgi:hypothetical protein